MISIAQKHATHIISMTDHHRILLMGTLSLSQMWQAWCLTEDYSGWNPEMPMTAQKGRALDWEHRSVSEHVCQALDSTTNNTHTHAHRDRQADRDTHTHMYMPKHTHIERDRHKETHAHVHARTHARMNSQDHLCTSEHTGVS